MSKKVFFEVGDMVFYIKIISELDVYLFVGIIGDFS